MYQIFTTIATVAILNLVTTNGKVVQENVPLRAVTNGLNQFATDFYKNLAEKESGNFVTSPLSVSSVLGMASYGARGTTQDELSSALHLSIDDTVTKNGFQSLIDSLNGAKKTELRLANKIFTKDGFEIKEEFKTITENVFRSIAESLDFSDAAQAAKTINDWSAEKTNNKIQDLVQPDDLRNAAIILVNAVYFKGSWKQPFRPALTKLQPFHVNGQTTKDVETMHTTSYFNFGSLPEVNAKYVELPYESENDNDSVSLFIVIPDEIDGLQHIEQNFEKINFAELKGQNTYLNLYLPKFQIESKFDLGQTLRKLGIQKIFGHSADFSGIADTPLEISKVIQKAYLKVDEKGSEAAAVTGSISVTSVPLAPTPAITVKVDRPFVYAIVQGTSNVTLFQGRVASPTASKQ